MGRGYEVEEGGLGSRVDPNIRGDIFRNLGGAI
jgi:hypothetical protein